MSNKFTEPWTISEKIGLLLNVLQGHNPDLLSFLVQVVHDQRIFTPRWNEIPLPQGRAQVACQAVFDDLVRGHRPTHAFQSVPGYTPASFSSTSTQPRVFTEHLQLQTGPRAIQPRPARSTDSPVPPTTNGDSLTIVRTAGPSEFVGDRRKKRGRPTKEEAEERDRALAAEGKVYEPKKRPSKKFRASTGTSVTMSEPGFSLSPAAPHTPMPQTVETKEESSSGKRRSRRQETTAQPLAEPSSPTIASATGAGPSLAESPSDRLFARFGEREPARPPSRDATTQFISDTPATTTKK